MKLSVLTWAAALFVAAPLVAQDMSMPDYRVSSPESVKAEEPLSHAVVAPGFSLGVRGAYMNDPDVDFDEGEGFGGVAARIHIFDFLSIEGLATWHREDDDDVETDIVPMQLSALIYLIPNSVFCPYLIGGVGWYWVQVEFDHPFEAFDFEETQFGFHAGLGFDIQVAEHFSITIDGRYIWLEDSDDFLPGVSDDEAYQLMGGINFDF